MPEVLTIFKNTHNTLVYCVLWGFSKKNFALLGCVKAVYLCVKFTQIRLLLSVMTIKVIQD